MAEIPIPWPLTAHPGRRPGEGQGDLINCYGAKVGEQVMVRRVAGAEKVYEIVPATVADFDASSNNRPVQREPRGMHAIREDYLVHVWDGALYFMEPDGDQTLITDTPLLTGSDRVTIASNLRPAGPQLVIVTDSGIANVYAVDYTPPPSTTTSTSYVGVDADIGTVTSVEYFSGYFIFTRTNGEIVASALQDTAIDPLSIAMAEYSSDDLLRCVNNGPTLLVFGKRSTEVWTDVGSSPFPLQKQTAVDVGLLGKWTVAGGPNQWGNGVYFIASDFTVRFMDGYRPVVVSNDAVSLDIYDYREDVGALSMCVYNFAQWSIVSISSPTWTWEYNVNTGNWHRRKSRSKDNWRGKFTAYFNGRWYVQMTGSAEIREYTDGTAETLDLTDVHGYLGYIDADLFTEPGPIVGETLSMTVESAPLKQYPANMRLPSIDVDVAMGVGSYVSASFEPAVLLSWSHDGGAAWSNPLIRSLGAQGEYSKRVCYRNLGRSTHHGTRLRLETHDPVPLVVMGGIAPRVSPSRPRGI